MNVQTYTCTYIRISVKIHTPTGTSTYISVYTCTHIHMHHTQCATEFERIDGARSVRGCTILSGDDILVHLAEKLRPACVVCHIIFQDALRITRD
jgi:hypothetical protein